MRYINLAIAVIIVIGVIVFPFINPCTDELLLCRTIQDGLTVIDYYGLTLYFP